MAIRKNKPGRSTRPPQKPKTPSKLKAALADLLEVRQRLELVKARAYVCAKALDEQNAESDKEVALVLRRDVGDEIDRQLENLYRISGRLRQGGAS